MHSIKQSGKDMENGHKKVLEVIENHFDCSVCTRHRQASLVQYMLTTNEAI